MEVASRGLDGLRTLADEIRKRKEQDSRDSQAPYPKEGAAAFWEMFWSRILPVRTDTLYRDAYPLLSQHGQAQNVAGMRGYVDELRRAQHSLRLDMEQTGHGALIKTEIARLLRLSSEGLGICTTEGSTTDFALIADTLTVDELRNATQHLDALWTLVHMRELYDNFGVGC